VARATLGGYAVRPAEGSGYSYTCSLFTSGRLCPPPWRPSDSLSFWIDDAVRPLVRFVPRERSGIGGGDVSLLQDRGGFRCGLVGWVVYVHMSSCGRFTHLSMIISLAYCVNCCITHPYRTALCISHIYCYEFRLGFAPLFPDALPYLRPGVLSTHSSPLYLRDLPLRDLSPCR
jgi:hypothetical protein